MPVKYPDARNWGAVKKSADGVRWSAYPNGDKPGALSSFSTTFPSSENPISQGGAFTVGTEQGGVGASGPASTGGSPGLCYASAGDGYDYAATIQGQFSTTKHYAEITIHRVGGYTAPDAQEVEILVGATLGSGVASAYELDLWFGGGHLQTVRWNPTPGDYDTGAVTIVSGSWDVSSLSDGDVVRAEFDSTSGSPVITVKLNGVTKVVYTDTTSGKLTSGSPGFGFFARTGSGFDATGYCIKGFAAGSL